MTASPSLANQINDLLPQTQCTKCGYSGCRPYANAVANGTASYNQCPPGGWQGISRLASLLNKPVIPLNPVNGVERARPRAVINENLCIGCTLCIKACPVDAIVGAPKQLHTVLADWCTGCDLCVSMCPVNCIKMIPVTIIDTGWDAWSPQQALESRHRHEQRNIRLMEERDKAKQRAATRRAILTQIPPTLESTAPLSTTSAGSLEARPIALSKNYTDAQKKAIIEMAVSRARKKKEEQTSQEIRLHNTSDVSLVTRSKIDALKAQQQRLNWARDNRVQSDPSCLLKPRRNNSDPDAG
ncbi:electron transport complex subunit RsxB [Candidatus Vallotiella sp. (ex Adelges kitamiensis)]|uniref:electron transport complex subunit RsxB n=1 Tax=Candidatus Vallotiella sp. (ex Adelges kitamiensis) TaxID=2864217 RepID=UPI001CE236FE|nr:electron transport complex subunit RsxB [Candidatus Vallotia sp. (ex Adelges kitamiensis)]